MPSKNEHATERYTTIAGEVLEYPQPTGELARFFARVVDAANDPRVSEPQLVELLYGTENPLLAQGLFRGRGAVTKEVFANPLYHVMLDLLDQKRVQVGTLEPDRAEARYTMTVAEAAEEIGVTTSAVRQAIAAGHLAAWKKGGRYLLDPHSVGTYRDRVTRRGPRAAPAVRVWYGNKPGASFRVKIPGLEIVDEERQGKRLVRTGEVRSFEAPARGAIAFSGKKMNRMFVIEPADEENRFEFEGDFGIEGFYRVVEKLNDPGVASDRFRCVSNDGAAWLMYAQGDNGQGAWVSAPNAESAHELAAEALGTDGIVVTSPATIPPGVMSEFRTAPQPSRIIYPGSSRARK